MTKILVDREVLQAAYDDLIFYINAYGSTGNTDEVTGRIKALLDQPDAPRVWPLTDAQIEAAVASVSVYRGEYTHAIARAIEAAHGIK